MMTDRHDQILETTLSIFSVKGYQFSLNDVAKELELKKQSLYYYFSSKDALIEQLTNREIARLIAYTSKVIDKLKPLDGEARLKGLYTEIMDYFTGDMRIILSWRFVLIGEANPRVEEYHVKLMEIDRMLYGYVDRIFGRGFPGVIADESLKDALIWQFITMVHGALQMALLYTDSGVYKQYRDKMWRAYWNGIIHSLSEPDIESGAEKR